MQTAIATVSLSGTLNEKLEAIALAQFRGVEMFENDLLTFNGTPAEVRRMIEDLGLRTFTFQPFFRPAGRSIIGFPLGLRVFGALPASPQAGVRGC